jgi:hypothetical protein
MTQTFRAGQKSKSPTTSSPVQTSQFANRSFTEPVQQKAQQPNLQTILQRAERAGNPISEKSIQKQEESIPNQTGLPDNLKAGIENLSGYSLDNVRVHYNSPKPAQLQALAYTQGTEIHVAPGQEKHLPHEAWHVVQQMQGRVKPTMQMKGVQINDDEGLEREADAMGKRAEYGKQELIAHELTYVVQQNGGAVMRSRLNSPQQSSELILQRTDIPGDGEDLANGTEPEEKLDGPYDNPKKRKRVEEGEEDDRGSKYLRLEEPIQTKRESGQLVFGQKEDSIQHSEKDQPNLWARTSSPDREVPFWGRTTTNSSENGSLVIQRVKTRYGGVPPVKYAGMMAGGGGGGHPPVPKNQWQTKTVKGTTYNFWNDADGTIQFTGALSMGDGTKAPGPALVAKHTVNIDAGGGKLKYTGRSLKNTRYQHFLAANIDYEGKNPPNNQGYSPPNFTWHHHKNQGFMELIDRDVHGAFGHHGGFSIWGS